MKKRIIFALLSSCVLLTGCSNTQDNTTQTQEVKKIEKQENGQAKMYDWEMQDLNGKTYKSSDFKGKKVYIKYWASWCHVCQETMPFTNKLVEEAKDDFVVLTVVSPKVGREKDIDGLKKYVEDNKLNNLIVLVDNGGNTIAKPFGISATPFNIVIDSENNIDYAGAGHIENELILRNMKEKVK